MKCTIKKACDLGKIIADYYGEQETEFLGSGIEVAVIFLGINVLKEMKLIKKSVLQKKQNR